MQVLATRYQLDFFIDRPGQMDILTPEPLNTDARLRLQGELDALLTHHFGPPQTPLVLRAAPQTNIVRR